MRRCLVVGTINRYAAPEGWEYLHVDVSDRPIYDRATGGTTVPDVVCDVRELSARVASGWDRVQLWDVLEHLSEEGAREALGQIYDVLLPDGELDVQVPNLDWAARRYAGGELSWREYLQLVFGQHLGVAHEEPDYHRFGWCPRTLAAILLGSGFEPGRDLASGSAVVRYRARKVSS